jgi:hypothetical protein
MPERHAAIKIEAEARIGPVNPSGGMQVRCLTDAARTLPEVGLSARHDAPPSGDVPELPVRHQDAAADSVMQLQELPPAVMQYQRHAQPLAVAAFTRHLNPRDERC